MVLPEYWLSSPADEPSPEIRATSALPGLQWRSGTVYVLPGDTFVRQPPLRFGEYEVRIPQLASLEAVRPLARIAVEPGDFPFLGHVRAHDDRLAEYARDGDRSAVAGVAPERPTIDRCRHRE